MSIAIILNANISEETIINCDENSAKSCFDAGKIYSAQAYKEKNYNRKEADSKVASFYKKSCDLGYAEGCRAYAMIYPAHLEKDPNKDAQYYFQKACDSGDEIACSMLKMMPEKI